jgi:alpha-beta hydrolase superfamily lysophospholipase
MKAFLACSAAAAALAAVATAAPANTIHPECVKAGDHATTVFPRTADGVRLAGVVLGKGTRGVVLAHESRGDLCEWMPFARALARAGYRVLPFDFRGYGESKSGQRVDFAADVVAAGRALRRAGANEVAYVGASMGGTAVLTASARAPAPAGVISLSGPATFGNLDAPAAVSKKSDVPLLLVAAKGDTGFAADQQVVYDAAAASDKQLVLVSGFDHGVNLLSGEARSRVRNLVLGFLRKHLP